MLFICKPFSNLGFIYEIMGCSLAYQVQTREAKLLSDIFVFFLRDSSYCRGILCNKLSLARFGGTVLHVSGGKCVYRCSHSKSCLEENIQLFKQVTCKCVLSIVKYKPQQ